MFDALFITAPTGWIALSIPLAGLSTVLALRVFRRNPAERPVARPVEHMTTQSEGAQQGDLCKAETAAKASGILALRAEISELESGNQSAGLAQLYLDLAWAEQQGGSEAPALQALRSAAGVAARFGPPSVHADARLELADAAFRAGDLTGACEQWQLARAALVAAGRTADEERIEQRMRDHGCPTDWVLTEF